MEEVRAALDKLDRAHSQDQEFQAKVLKALERIAVALESRPLDGIPTAAVGSKRARVMVREALLYSNNNNTK